MRLLLKKVFEFYLNHGYATSTISSDHQQLSNNITSNFDGKVKAALTVRFDDNVKKAYF